MFEIIIYREFFQIRVYEIIFHTVKRLYDCRKYSDFSVRYRRAIGRPINILYSRAALRMWTFVGGHWNSMCMFSIYYIIIIGPIVMKTQYNITNMLKQRRNKHNKHNCNILLIENYKCLNTPPSVGVYYENVPFDRLNKCTCTLG